MKAMTEEAKQRYNEDPAHYELIRKIVKDSQKPMYVILAAYISITVGVMGFFYVRDSDTKVSLQSKANTSDVQRDYIQKLQYYQIEQDEHRMVLRLYPDQALSSYIFGQINDNIASELGFKYTTRGGMK